MRKQLKAKTISWTPQIYKKAFDDKPPVSYKKSVEIIDSMHAHIIDFVITTRRPVQLRKTIGYMEFRKKRLIKPIFFYDSTKEKGMKKLNHHSDCSVYSVNFQFSSVGNRRLFKFKALRRYRRELTKKIFLKDVQ